MTIENPGEPAQAPDATQAPPASPAASGPQTAPFNLTAADFTFSRASIVMIAGGAITVVGYLLPWASVSGTVLGQSLGTSVAGSDVLVVLLGLGMAVGGAAFAYHPPQFKVAWMAVGIVAILALVLMLRYFGDYNNAKSALSPLGGLAGISLDLGIGFFLSIVGSVVALVGAALGRGETLGRSMF